MHTATLEEPVHETPAEVEEAVSPQSGLVDVNHASSQELQSLPGIGPVLAQRILDWRKQNGPYKRLEDLLLVRGIGTGRFEKIKPFVTLTP